MLSETSFFYVLLIYILLIKIPESQSIFFFFYNIYRDLIKSKIMLDQCDNWREIQGTTRNLQLYLYS